MKFYLLTTALIMAMLLMPLASAFEFDNIKTYDPIDREVTFKNSFLGIPTTEIATVKLNTPLVYYVIPGEDRKVAEFTINLFEDYDNPLKSLDLYAKYGLKLDRKITYKYKEYYEIDVADMGEKCFNTIDKGKEVLACVPEALKTTHKETREKWTNLDTAKLTKGTYDIGIFTDVKPGDYVEWIPTMFGNNKVEEWAVWADSLSVGLVGYYNFDSSNNITLPDNRFGKSNFTITVGSGVNTTTGKLKKGFDFDGTATVMLNISTNSQLHNSTNMTWVAWIYPHEATCGAGATYNSIMADQSGNLDLRFVGSTCKISFDTQTGGDLPSVTDIKPNAWNFVAITYGGGTKRLYVNGTEESNEPGNWFTGDVSPYHTRIGKGGNGYFNGVIDEIGIWNRTLLPAEVADLYNGSYGMTLPLGVSNSLTVNLNSPADDYNISTNSVTFNCSATDETAVLNLTLIIDNVANYTITNSSAGQNLSLQTTLTLGEGSHTWTCNATDGVDLVGASSTRKLYIDTITPKVNILYPTDSLEIITFNSGNNITFNISITEAGILRNCFYYNGTGNTTLTCRNNATINLTTSGYKTFAYYANDSTGNLGSNSTTFLLNYVRPSVSYAPTGIELENTTFYFNLTVDSLVQANATLNYNNTLYDMSILSSNSTNAVFYKTLTLPDVVSNTVKQFNVSYYFNGVAYNTSTYNQTVYTIPNLNITAGLCAGTPVYWFTLQDEENLTVLTGDFEYNFYYGLSNSSSIRTYGKITGSTNFSICVNSTINSSWNIGSGEIIYSSTGYVDRRYYIFDNTVVSSATNLTLYDLLSTSQTSFKLEIEDTSLNPYNNIYNRLLRWYPDLNEYKIVDMGKTDDTGSTVIHVRTEDVDYRIGAYYTNGTLIYLAQPIRMVCLASPCTYTLKISPGEVDYTSFLNIVYSFTYNETSGIWDFTYSDATGKTSTMNLTVWRDTSTSSFIVCSQSISGAVGALSCNTSIYTTGTLRGEVFRSASPPVQVVQKVVSLFTSAFKGSSFGLFLSMLLALPLIFLLVMVSPIGAIVGGVIALLPALYFGSINIGIVGGFAVLAGIVAHFLKRIS